MQDLRSRIILEAIKVGSSDTPSLSFSTKAIASALEIKEFEVFAYFPTKKAILEAARDFLYESQMAYMLSLIDKKSSFDVFVDSAIDYFLAHPEEVFFLLNYLPGLAKASTEASDLARYHERMVYWGKKVLCFFVLEDDEEYFVLWSAMFRSLLYAAANILRGEAESNDASRTLLKELLHDGLHSFFGAEVS